MKLCRLAERGEIAWSGRAAAIALLALSGCWSSPYRRSYRAIPSAPSTLAPCVGEPSVDIPDDPQATGQALRKQGYATIGASTFDSVVPDPSRDPELLKQAKRVGACRVVLSYNAAGHRRVGIGVEERQEAAFEVSAIYFAKPK